MCERCSHDEGNQLPPPPSLPLALSHPPTLRVSLFHYHPFFFSITTAECECDDNVGLTRRQATAWRLANEEQERQHQRDELLALHLAARENAGMERRASRRRVAHQGARRSSSPGPPLSDADAAAVAAAAAFGGGDGVSDAVRALQFQDIEADDYETLLALDEAGGEGGRCCAGGKGLTEEAVDAALRAGVAAGEMLEESCAICLLDYELDDEVCVRRVRVRAYEKASQSSSSSS